MYVYVAKYQWAGPAKKKKNLVKCACGSQIRLPPKCGPSKENLKTTGVENHN